MNKGYSICLNEWALDTKIKNELPLLLIISSLCAEKGYCFASNEYLADKFKTTEETISRKLKKLEKKGYINIQYERYGFKVDKRFIRIAVDENINCAIDENVNGAIDKNINGAIDENVKDKNTSINNTSINNLKESEAFSSAIDEFKQMRKTIKKPMTDNAMNRLIKKLDSMANSEEEKIAILNQSVDHCWQDIYPLKKPLIKSEEPVEEEKEDINDVIKRIESRVHH